MITGGWSGTPEAFHLARFRMAEVRAHAEEARAIALNMSHEPMAHAVMEICAALEKLSGGKL
jgi:hypothetical protein